MAIALEGNLKACADGDHYAPADRMTEMPDGRKICEACLTAIRQRAEARTQQDLFIRQDSLFDLFAG